MEMLDGPMASSKFFPLYTPRGAQTGVTVDGEFTSKRIPPAQLQRAVRGFLEQVYHEDNAVIKAVAGKK